MNYTQAKKAGPLVDEIDHLTNILKQVQSRSATININYHDQLTTGGSVAKTMQICGISNDATTQDINNAVANVLQTKIERLNRDIERIPEK